MADLKLPAGFWELVRKVAAEEARKATRGLLNGGSVTQGDFTIKGGGSLVVQDGGDVVVDADGEVRSTDFVAGSSGWRLDDVAEFNQLILRDGIVGDDALAHITKASAAATDTQTGWSTSTSMATKASTTLTVPSGVDHAWIIALGTVIFQDTAPNRFDCRVQIAGNSGETIINLASNVGSSSPNHMRVIAVTPGDTLTVNLQVLSAVATGGQPANQASIKAGAMFYR